MKSKQLIKKLKKHGVEITKGRGKGRHQLAEYNGKQTTIPIHGEAESATTGRTGGMRQPPKRGQRKAAHQIKFEYRSTKFETIPNDRNSND